MNEAISKRNSIYSMHKYWGKKPFDELARIISRYSEFGDTILDPFSGFGGFAVEGILQNRNVIINDLNPAAVFIAENVLNEKIDVKKLKELIGNLKCRYSEFEKEWYSFRGAEIITILRNSSDVPLKVRVKSGKNMKEMILTAEEQSEFVQKENSYKITTWFPNDKIIPNSRISAKVGMTTADLFPKRALICQSFLFDLISDIEDSPEKNLLIFTFTSNLANCSKLVPPIASRGDMAQGAWMTGFYVGATYLENNVFHYFENRISKTVKGKEAYLRLRKENNVVSTYRILNRDAKALSIGSASVDFIFTDFPYGDTVPYFEQAQLWNHWLKNKVDYENEIVVSNSAARNKDMADFRNGIERSVSEIARVLKDEKYFVFTFHSLSGEEWSSIVSALKKHNFIFKDCEIMLQKTLPPRQLNRINTVKGDIVAVYKKVNGVADCDIDFETNIRHKIGRLSGREVFDANDLIVLCIKSMLESNFDFNIDFKNIIDKYFVIDENIGKWRKAE